MRPTTPPSEEGVINSSSCKTNRTNVIHPVFIVLLRRGTCSDTKVQGLVTINAPIFAKFAASVFKLNRAKKIISKKAGVSCN